MLNTSPMQLRKAKRGDLAQCYGCHGEAQQLMGQTVQSSAPGCPKPSHGYKHWCVKYQKGKRRQLADTEYICKHQHEVIDTDDTMSSINQEYPIARGVPRDLAIVQAEQRGD